MAKLEKVVDKDSVLWCDRGWFPLQYGFCPNEKAWDKLLKVRNITLTGNEYASGTAARTTSFISSEHTFSIVTVGEDETNTPLETVGLLIHEASHVLDAVIDAMNDKAPSEEFRAYSIQAIALNLVDAYEETRGPLMIELKSMPQQSS